jgi:hypothetical protein
MVDSNYGVHILQKMPDTNMINYSLKLKVATSGKYILLFMLN